ncbi:hypothetical protein RvY_02968 [Ramazzottius varieornatus]|uniref:Uncharacterized protein n=1 Tax=Ramazzottius varieornatus TaxID=947166 RepID=A0A1D1UTJ4_RAMVA|nr:hypothetical protein RvY_02968 [Ramazzottius varieornatus]
MASPVEFKINLEKLWKILGQSYFESSKFGLSSLTGRRKAIALLVDRSPRTIEGVTRSWDLVSGPPKNAATDSQDEDGTAETFSASCTT